MPILANTVPLGPPILAWTAALLSGCDTRAPGGSDRPVVLVASGDTAGWIVPCGCASNQSGGLLRRGTFVNNLRQKAEVIVVDVGGAAAGTTEYDKIRFEAILQGERALGVVAHNIGLSEARLGEGFLREIAGRTGVPLVSCNVRSSSGKQITEPVRFAVAGGRRLAILGVLSDQTAVAGLQIDSPRQAIVNALASLNGKYDSLVVLAYLAHEELEQLAGQLPEADIVVGGPTGQAVSPQRIGPTLLAAATNKGKFLARFEIPAGGRSQWTGQIVEIDGSFSDDTVQRENLARLYSRLADRDSPATDTSFAAKFIMTTHDARVAGSASCQKCHAEDFKTWEQSRHAHARDSLSQTGAHVDSFCQQCHTTGFGWTDGFSSLRQSPALFAVGCESCHGPSAEHVADSKVATPRRGVAAQHCQQCHDRENSPQFNFDTYWARIQHGQKAPGPDVTRQAKAVSP